MRGTLPPSVIPARKRRAVQHSTGLENESLRSNQTLKYCRKKKRNTYAQVLCVTCACPHTRTETHHRSTLARTYARTHAHVYSGPTDKNTTCLRKKNTHTLPKKEKQTETTRSRFSTVTSASDVRVQQRLRTSGPPAPPAHIHCRRKKNTHTRDQSEHRT